MDDLSNRDIRQYSQGEPSLQPLEYKPLLACIKGWSVVDEHHLSRVFEFDDFITALAFVNQVGDVAENINHHPDIHLAWGRVHIEIWTHTVSGLTLNDFIFAAKIDQLFVD